MNPPHPVTSARIRSPYVVVLALLLAACGGDDSAATPTTTSSTSTSVVTTTTTTAPSTTATTAPPPTPRPSAMEAVDALLSAWRAGDRAVALTVAEVAAVDALFAITP